MGTRNASANVGCGFVLKSICSSLLKRPESDVLHSATAVAWHYCPASRPGAVLALVWAPNSHFSAKRKQGSL